MYPSMDPIETLAACCAPPAGPPLARRDAEKLAAQLRVLADPARLQILSVIASRPGGEACVCDLPAPLGLSQPTVSHHLRVLHQAGLLEREQRGRWAHYRLVPERFRALAAPAPSRVASI
jgi:ArsR family transcriptional regulator